MNEIGFLWMTIIILGIICISLYNGVQENKKTIEFFNTALKEPINHEMYLLFLEYTSGYRNVCRFNSEIMKLFEKEYISWKNEKEKLNGTGFELTQEHFVTFLKGKFYDGSKTFSKDWTMEEILPYDQQSINKLQISFWKKSHGKQ